MSTNTTKKRTIDSCLESNDTKRQKTTTTHTVKIIIIDFDYVCQYKNPLSNAVSVDNKSGTGNGRYIGLNEIDDCWKDIMEGNVINSIDKIESSNVNLICNISNIKVRVLSPDEVEYTIDNDGYLTLFDTVYPNITYIQGELHYSLNADLMQKN